MSEQEVQWGEWQEGTSGLVKRYGYALKDVPAHKVEYITASYLNALEREVRDLRAYKVLADEAREEWDAGNEEKPILRRLVRGLRALDSLPSTSEGEGK